MYHGTKSVCFLAMLMLGIASGVETVTGQLVLFPFTASEVNDGDPSDATGAANDMIVIDPNNPVNVPGYPGLEFSGMVQHGTAGSLNVGQATGLRSLLVSEIPAGYPGAGSPAVLHNNSASTIVLSGPLDWVMYDYLALHPNNTPGAAELAIHFQGPLDTTPSGGTLGGTDHELGLSVIASTWFYEFTGQPDPMSAGWLNPGTTAAPVTFSGWNAGYGDYNLDPGVLRITLDRLVLHPGERFEFPASVSAGLIPEPVSGLLLLAGAGLLINRRPRRGGT